MFDIYIHSNKKNIIPAKVGKYSFEKITNKTVNIINMEDFDNILDLHNKYFYRNNVKCQLNINSSQSFFLLRFIIPYYHKYVLKNDNKKKWILIMDPDIFCIKDIIDELNKYIQIAEKKNKYIIAHNKLSSFMLINTQELIWEPTELIENIFNKKENFNNYMSLQKYNDICLNIPEYFNHYDKLNSFTKCLHISLTHTQPWKKGLKYLKHDLHNMPYNKNDNNYLYFQQHKNKEIENTFFKLFKEAYDNNYITNEDINLSIELEGLLKDYEKYLI
jgi:hypothetical protein